MKGTSLETRSEFIHFACTSEDINNMSHALMLRDGKKVLRSEMDALTANGFVIEKAMELNRTGSYCCYRAGNLRTAR